jgi:hypothetical protein
VLVETGLRLLELLVVNRDRPVHEADRIESESGPVAMPTIAPRCRPGRAAAA